MRSLVISRKNIIKKDVTMFLLHPFLRKILRGKKFPYANRDSRDPMVAAYDSCAGEPSDTV